MWWSMFGLDIPGTVFSCPGHLWREKSTCKNFWLPAVDPRLLEITLLYPLIISPKVLARNRESTLYKRQVHHNTGSQILRPTLIKQPSSMPTKLYLKFMKHCLSVIHLIAFLLKFHEVKWSHQLGLILNLVTVKLASHMCHLSLIHSMSYLSHHINFKPPAKYSIPTSCSSYPSNSNSLK